MLNIRFYCVGLAVFAIGVTAFGQADDHKNEDKLIAILQSDAAEAEKAITCKRLAVFGSEKAVPAIAPLLENERLTSWARIALEAIPGDASEAALREAMDKVNGRVLVGVINSIGVKQDAKAVEGLGKKLAGSDGDVASAAAVALGHIGNANATKLLTAALENDDKQVRSSVAYACVLSAERMLENGDAEAATKLYDQVRETELPKQRLLEATRGAILARGEDGNSLLIEQLRSEDPEFFGLALRVSREIEGEDLTKAIAAELDGAKPDRLQYMVLAISERSDNTVLPTIMQSAKSKVANVQRVAIEALGRVGDASCLSTLLDAASSNDAELKQAALGALQKLPGDSVDAEVKKQLSAGGKHRKALIELVGLRRIDAVPQLVKASNDSSSQIRAAALMSLGATVGPDDLGVLVDRLLSKKYASEFDVARKALLTASVRMPDPDAATNTLKKGLSSGSTNSKIAFLEIIGAVGGTESLRQVGQAAKSSNDAIKDSASRLLGKWMTKDAAPVLLGLAKPIANDKYTVRALRGFLRIARQFKLPMDERVQMCRDALKVAGRDAEKKLVLQILQRYASAPTLQLAVEISKSPGLKTEAQNTALVIAQKIGGDSDTAKKLLSQIDLKPVKVEIVRAVYGSGKRTKDVTKKVAEGVGNLPIVSLSNPSFNACFGGDPAPGVVKKLTITYKMDGVEGEASFAENSMILLPKPTGKK